AGREVLPARKEGDRRAPARGLGSLRRRLGHRGFCPGPAI
ncbi:MAG: hypothetical protein AVDCRST_MAG80-2405, partial [uncultured Rubrobacteraceae bacterium]